MTEEGKIEEGAAVKDYHKDVHGKPYARGLMFGLLLIGTFGGMLTQTFLGTAYPTLMTDFHISLATAQGASTWFLLANGIMIPVSAYLTTKFSTKWLFTLAYTLAFVGTLICYMAPTSSWGVFLLGRIVQAMAVGISMPLFMTVIVNMFPPESIGVPMGLGGLVIGLAPAIGPTYAGWLLSGHSTFLGVIQLGNWRTIFLLPLLMLGISAVLTPIFARDILKNRTMKLDILSLLLSLVGFGLFLLGFTNVASDGWGDLTSVILPIAVGLVIIVVFIWRQLRMTDPFLDLSVFKDKQFSWTTVAAAVNTIAMMGIELMLPTYVQNVHGLSAFQSGLLLLPGSVMMAVMSPIAGSVYNKKGARPLAFVGFIMLAIGTFPYMFLTATTPEHFITTTYWLRFVAIGMIMMPLITSAMNALPVEKAAQGSASNNTARMIASSVGVALLASVTQNVTTNASPAKHLQTTDPLSYASKMIDAALTGFHTSFAIAFVFALMGIVCAFFLHKGKIVHTADGKEIDAIEAPAGGDGDGESDGASATGDDGASVAGEALATGSDEVSAMAGGAAVLTASTGLDGSVAAATAFDTAVANATEGAAPALTASTGLGGSVAAVTEPDKSIETVTEGTMPELASSTTIDRSVATATEGAAPALTASTESGGSVAAVTEPDKSVEAVTEGTVPELASSTTIDRFVAGVTNGAAPALTASTESGGSVAVSTDDEMLDGAAFAGGVA